MSETAHNELLALYSGTPSVISYLHSVRSRCNIVRFTTYSSPTDVSSKAMVESSTEAMATVLQFVKTRSEYSHYDTIDRLVDMHCRRLHQRHLDSPLRPSLAANLPSLKPTTWSRAELWHSALMAGSI